MSGVDKKASAVNHEWRPGAGGIERRAQLEGDDPTANALVPTVRLGDLCQISYKMAQVSGTQQAVDHAGRIVTRLPGDARHELKDIETILVGSTGQGRRFHQHAAKTASVLSGSSTARRRNGGRRRPCRRGRHRHAN